MDLADLSTPSLLVDKSRLRENLEAMQATADRNGVALRPHAKTHKCTAIAARQQTLGADGLTVATVAEAEAFVEDTADDVRVAYPVTGVDKHERLQALRRQADISFSVDTIRGADQAASVYDDDDPVDVLMEVDVGHGRCGIPWNHDEAAVHLARRIVGLSGLRLVGILTHAGQAYDGPGDAEAPRTALRRVAQQERDRMLRTAARLQHADIPRAHPDEFEISIGSTPSISAFENDERDGFRITEIRPGNYVMHDAMQVALGAASYSDCALSVLTTVVSTQRTADGRNRAFVDAGKKMFTTDTGYGTEGYGTVLRDVFDLTPHSDVRLDHLSEEHGWLTVPTSSSLDVGDRLRIIPNHACVTVANHSTLTLVDDRTVVDEWPIDAKGW